MNKKNILLIELLELLRIIRNLTIGLVFTTVTIILTLAAKVCLHDNFDLAYDISYVAKRKYGFHMIFVLDSLENIPREHLELLKEDGYNIVISEELLNDVIEEHPESLKIPANEVMGLTDHSSRTIYLRSKLAGIGYTTLHEVGHAIDKCNGTLSKGSEFKECFDSEKDGIRKYAQSGTGEYFADLYALINFKYDDIMLGYTEDDFPESTKYIKSHLW